MTIGRNHKEVPKPKEELIIFFCKWELIDEESNVYDTSCRNPHILLEGTPKDNNYNFCPHCGREIKF